VKLKELTPRSNATYEEAGELELGDGTYVSLYRYPGQKLRVQIKHPDPDKGRFAVTHLASATGKDEGTQILLIGSDRMEGQEP